jgi:ABC-2 type transport system permease protein
MYFLFKYLRRLWRERQARLDSGSRDDGAPRSVRAPRPARDTGPSAAARGAIALVAHEVRYDLITSLRNPRARFFTFFFPILLLVVFNGVFGNGHTVVAGVHHVALKVFYVPGILAMSVITASYASLVISVSTMRESGVLKRRRATPAPASLLIAGQALSAVAITAVMSTLLLVIARVAYGVGVAPASIGAIAVMVVIGTISFACIAYAVAGLIGSPDAAQPIVQATMLPLWFISGVFIPVPNLSSTLRHIGDLFPVEHLANSLHLASVHSSFSASISGTDVLVLGLWAVGAMAFAAWRFSWLPSTATA